MIPIEVTVNGRRYRETVPARLLLSDFIRHTLGLTGTHVGCEHGVCGCCTILVDGAAARSCLMLAVQADGVELRTIEGLAEGEELHPVQAAFREAHGLQCGFCTPGFVLAITAFLEESETVDLSDGAIREAIAGNLCRCTGYQNIVEAVRIAARAMGKASA